MAQKIMTDSERQVEMAVDAKRRAENCLVDIKNVLAKWNCGIEPVIILSAQGIERKWMVVAMMQIPPNLEEKKS